MVEMGGEGGREETEVAAEERREGSGEEEKEPRGGAAHFCRVKLPWFDFDMPLAQA